jgi:methyl-accepting chemotaxis protein
MQNIPIIGKFMAILALFGLFALGVAIYSGEVIKRTDAAYSDLLDDEAHAALSLARASRSLQEMRASANGLMMARSQSEYRQGLEAIKGAREGVEEYVGAAAKALPDDARIPALKVDVLDVVERSCENAWNLAGKAASDADVLANQAVFLAECKPAFVAAIPKFRELTDTIVDAADKHSAALTMTSNSAALETIAGVIVGMFAVGTLGFFAIRSWVVMPIRSLSATMGVLAGGELSADVLGTARRDEVGTMAKAVQVFKDNGLRAGALEQEAAEARSHTEAERARVAEQERLRAVEMEQATSGLAGGLKQIADGNLTCRLEEAFAPDFEGLRVDFNSAVAQLRETLNAVVHATATIDSGSRELSQSANDLSKRTEQQAAALEETAAALDEITANVSSSTKLAHEARTVAVQANQAARESGGVVASAVDAMQRIEQSSNQIANIIGVIDEIAFQTNLLALNAGVEAARAGDAGKGFAVVAQEVRELAQRSAQAAKEIKDLIRHSSTEVGAGVKLVCDTGEALKTIEGYVASVNAHMDAIAISSQEQSVGLSQVNTAVNQMDQTTQQNAAMVEQSTAASAGLAAESQKLRDMLSRFRLDETGATRPMELGPRRVADHHAPVASPARRMVGKVAMALGLAKARQTEEWEEF